MIKKTYNLKKNDKLRNSINDKLKQACRGLNGRIYLGGGALKLKYELCERNVRQKMAYFEIIGKKSESKVLLTESIPTKWAIIIE